MLSRRERIIGIATVVVLAALVADRFVMTPAMGKLEQLETQKQQLLAELTEAQNLFERRRLMERKWQQLSAEGLKSESEAESQVLHALGQWAGESRLTLTSVKPQRLSAVKNGLQEMTFSVAGTGSLQAAARFLWHVERASLPVRIKDMQLGSANEQGDRMSLQLQLSGLYVGGRETKPGDEHEQDSQL